MLKTAISDLTDQFNRKITNLRLSVIDRCNLRCQYCIVDEKISWVPKSELLTFDEYIRLVSIFSQLGIKTIRITGGEPLIRPRVSSLIKDITSIPQIEKVSMTTNGVILNQYLDSLEDAKLSTINISLDTLDSNKYFKITKRNQLFTTLSNIKSAINSTIEVKINCVALKGFNENEILDFVEYAIKNNINVRFIEFMPFNGNNWLESAFISSLDIKKIIEEKYTLIPKKQISEFQTSRNYGIEGNLGSIGFISSVSESFCKWCNRARITAEGSLRTCLHDSRETNLKALLRSGSPEETIKKTIKDAVFNKSKGHVNWIDPNIIWKIPIDDREMLRIGG